MLCHGNNVNANAPTSYVTRNLPVLLGLQMMCLFLHNFPQQIVTFCYVLDLRRPKNMRSTSNPPSTESLVKIFCNGDSIMRWFAILLHDSCYPQTFLTHLQNKPLPKQVQTSTVIGTCIKKHVAPSKKVNQSRYRPGGAQRVPGS